MEAGSAAAVAAESVETEAAETVVAGHQAAEGSSHPAVQVPKAAVAAWAVPVVWVAAAASAREGQ